MQGQLQGPWQSQNNCAPWSRFATPNPDDTAGLFVASCLLTRAPIGSAKEDGTKKFVIRPYTPTSTVDARGHFDLVHTTAPARYAQHLTSPVSTRSQHVLCVSRCQIPACTGGSAAAPWQDERDLSGMLWDMSGPRW